MAKYLAESEFKKSLQNVSLSANHTVSWRLVQMTLNPLLCCAVLLKFTYGPAALWAGIKGCHHQAQHAVVAASASSASFERGRLCFLRLSDERSLPKALRLYRSTVMVLVLAAGAGAALATAVLIVLVVFVITNDIFAVVVAVIVRDV